MPKTKEDIASFDVVKPLQETFVAALESAITAQEHGLKYVQTLYEAGLETTKYQTESATRMAEVLAEQAQKQRDTFQKLTERAIQSYTDALQTALSAYDKQA
jgi:polyhydroxyalkanoate synthesis regulator phasin